MVQGQIHGVCPKPRLFFSPDNFMTHFCQISQKFYFKMPDENKKLPDENKKLPDKKTKMPDKNVRNPDYFNFYCVLGLQWVKKSCIIWKNLSNEKAILTSFYLMSFYLGWSYFL